MLLAVFEDVLKLLHPFIPFVTEELWHAFPFGKRSSAHRMARSRLEKIDEAVIRDMDLVREVIRSVQEPQGRGADSTAAADTKGGTVGPQRRALIRSSEALIKLLTKAEKLEIMDSSADKPQKSLASVLDDVQIYLPVGDLLDVDKEIQRLNNDLSKIEKDIEKGKAKLANPQFIERAPEVIRKEKETLADNETRGKG